MKNDFALIYQYFDNAEIKLEEQIEKIQDRCLYRSGRELDYSEAQEIAYLKLKLDQLNSIEKDILKMFWNDGRIE